MPPSPVPPAHRPVPPAVRAVPLLVVLTVLFSLALSLVDPPARAVDTAAVEPGTAAPTDGTGSAGVPSAEELPAAMLPSPSPDPWYHAPVPDASIPPGTILETRPVVLPGHNVWIPHRAWQVRLRSTDAHGRPMSVVSTVIVPTAPVLDGGPRPMVSLDQPIDALGLMCNPSWRLRNEHVGDFPPVTNELLGRGWALVITDHQGPRMAYAAGRLAGHAVLDGVRAAKALPDAGLAGSPVILNGYSGGAIASGWAGQLQPAYAPELTGQLVGVVPGGTPTDFALLFDTMNGTFGSGLFRAAIFGIAREYTELAALFNPYGRAMAASLLKDECSELHMGMGALTVPIEFLASDVELRTHPATVRVLAENRMGGSAPTAPVLLFHGSASVDIGDEFIPEAGALRLRDEWCAQGAHVEYLPVFGEHLLAPVFAREPTFAWMADRFAGRPLPPGCVGANPV